MAYHWPSDRTVTIDDILRMRRGNDPRAGDLWCHKACYPHTGEMLLSRIVADLEVQATLLGFRQGPDPRKLLLFFLRILLGGEHINYGQAPS